MLKPKKNLLPIIAGAVTALLFTVSPVFAADWGDADLNGKLEAADSAIVLQKVMNSSFTIDDSAIEKCDVDCDGKLTSFDAAIILQKVLNNNYVMPCENTIIETTTETTTESTTVTTTETTTESTTVTTTETTTESTTVTTTETTTESTTVTATETTTQSTTVTTETTTESTTVTTENTTESTTLDPDGIIVKNFKDLKNAVSNKNSIIYVQNDIDCSEQLNLTAKNANTSIIGIVDENGRIPSLDFSSAGKIGDSKTGLYVSGSYYNFENIIVENAPNCGMRITGSGAGHCSIENCIFRYNGNCGVSVTSGGEYNSFINCYSYRNCDLHNGGSDADGFGVKLTPGKGNKFYGCMAWENGDDGWDSYAMPYEIYYEECACWNNGNYKAYTGELDYEEGNPLDKNLLFVQAILKKYPDFEERYNNALKTGEKLNWPTDVSISLSNGSRKITDFSNKWRGNPNGFKFGSYATNHANGEVGPSAYRNVKNCLAFNHGGKGFDQNNCYATFDFENTLGFDNGWKNTKPNYMMDRMTLGSCINAVGFNGTVEDLLPVGMEVITPDEAEQAELRNTVMQTRQKVLERVYNNLSPGEILFDVYK